MRYPILVSSCLFLFLIPRIAFAEDITAAKEHYDRGTTLYDLQRFPDAAKEYELAYEAKHDPALLFNIGQAYRFAGDYAKAIGAFRSFLRRLPHTPNKLEVEARIAEMQKLLDEQKRNMEKPPAGTIAPLDTKTANEPTRADSRPAAREPAPLPSPTSTVVAPSPAPELDVTPPSTTTISETPKSAAGRSKKIAGIVIAAVGVGAIAAGAAFAALATSAYDEINTPSKGYVFNPATQDQMKTDQALEAVFLSIGGAAVIAGVAVLVVGVREAKRAPNRFGLTPVLGPTHAGASLSLSF